MAQAPEKEAALMIRISITGPESTGKSWLAERLAVHYHTKWVPEYAREYLLKINRPYTYNDILLIAREQFRLENLASENSDLLFCDTDFCVTHIWCRVKYNKCHPWIRKKTAENLYDLYLLCDIDLPWQFDPLREHPEMRRELFDMYQKLLSDNHCNYHIVSGLGDERLYNAIRLVDEFLQ